jgi:large subunit ribosomal protein L35
MPKMKTRRATAKRFRVGGKGRIKVGKAFHSHILSKKSKKRKRGLRGMDTVDEADAPRVKRMLGLG